MHTLISNTQVGSSPTSLVVITPHIPHYKLLQLGQYCYSLWLIYWQHQHVGGLHTPAHTDIPTNHKQPAHQHCGQTLHNPYTSYQSNVRVIKKSRRTWIVPVTLLRLACMLLRDLCSLSKLWSSPLGMFHTQSCTSILPLSKHTNTSTIPIRVMYGQTSIVIILYQNLIALSHDILDNSKGTSSLTSLDFLDNNI